ncbi:MAG: hypothetical protein R2706_17115 [Acidimicrobiales bacterium]
MRGSNEEIGDERAGLRFAHGRILERSSRKEANQRAVVIGHKDLMRVAAKPDLGHQVVTDPISVVAKAIARIGELAGLV